MQVAAVSEQGEGGQAMSGPVTAVPARRIIGLDLGISSAHHAVVVDETGRIVLRRRLRPLVSELMQLEDLSLQTAPDGARLTVVIEPTGPAWLPIAVFFARRGHTVVRVTSGKSAKLRMALSAKAKTNGIDAQTLARLPLFDPDGVRPLDLPDIDHAELDRLVRLADRLTTDISRHKQRIRSLARMVMPMLDAAIPSEIADCDITLLARYGDPHSMVKAGRARLAKVLAGVAKAGLFNAERRAEAWLEVARAAIELYGLDPAVPFDAVALELASEAARWRLAEDELKRVTRMREQTYLRTDPEQLARSLPGIAKVGGPLLVASMGRPERFERAAQFRSFTGLTPRTSGTGDSDSKGTGISRVGNSSLRHQLTCSVNIARKQDPQLARIYYEQMVHRGAHHTKAVCVVAAHLADRAWQVMRRGTPYVIRDIDGTPVSAEQAARIIADRYTVSPEVRRRRRSGAQAGKAPQQAREALGKSRPRADNRGDLPRARTAPPNHDQVKQQLPCPASTPTPNPALRTA
jgi:transposase